MGCATATIKYLVFIFNALCAILGIGTVVVSSLALKNVADEDELTCIGLIVLGSIVFLISFFGCCGAIRENVCCTWTYAVFLLILVVANLVLMLCFANKIDEKEMARNDIEHAWEAQVNGTGNGMDFYQSEYHCCGKNGVQDYTAVNLTIPNSCYIFGSPTHANNTNTNSTNSVIADAAEIYADGCLAKLSEFYSDARHLMDIFSWTTLGVESAALIFACILAITFHNERRRSRY